MVNKFSKNSTLAEILGYPGIEKILAKHNLPCLWCPLARFEAESLKIGQICEVYQIDSEKLLKNLNKFISKTKKKKKD